MNNEIVKTLQSLSSPKILIIGDLMIDHFTWGTVSRISPEAPTPVLAYEEETFQLGGAGFTANVLHQLGAQVDLAAVCGEDNGREILFNLLKEHNIGSSGIIADSSRTTTRKQRFQARDADLSSGMQQMIRVDFENTAPINEPIQQKLITFIEKNGKNYDAIIASDYGKGVLTQAVLKAIAACKKTTPVFADPKKGASLSLYKGFTAMKPNRYEAESYVGYPLQSKKDIIKAGKTILKEADLDYTFISLDAEGIFYIQKDDYYLFVPTRKKEVYDVAGAGDSVLSIMALLASSNPPPRYLMEVANIAAGIMISQKQPKTITIDDIIKHILVGEDAASRKVKTVIELKSILNSSDSRNRKVYFTNGFFDNINPNQIKFLEKLGMYEGIRVVAINSDKSILESGCKPNLKESDRIRLLQMFDCIDYVVVFDSSCCDNLLVEIQPDFFLKGINYKGLEIAEKKTLDKINCKVEYVDAN
jgi:D-beta-D-heptose 7-phosphate kinase/D-beta-D-heptose 1-phosphate adenosyltransferase